MVDWAGVCGPSGDSETDEMGFTAEQRMSTQERSSKMANSTTHEFFIAGVKFHQLHTVIDDLEEGANLMLVPEPSNKFDPNAVRIEYATFEKQAMLGYVPKKFSSEVCAMIEVGKTLECILTRLNKSAKPWEMAKVEIQEVVEEE